ncbi:hypothetical protein [Flavobacterium maritimum]|uniref:hypothetical protein n=1 Tax=Flavobacterium maritimum TaxID=3149042 RepID=UPI0032B436F2
MKPFQILLVSAFLLLSAHTVSAQYGNSGYGYGNNGYGRNNRMSQMNNAGPERSQPKEIPVEVTVGKIMDRLKTELTLDELQVIAISNILTQSMRTQGIIIKQETSQADKIKDIKALSDITDSKVTVLLNKEQKEKYIILSEEMKNPKKSKSEKKSKKKSEEKSEEKSEIKPEEKLDIKAEE